MRRVIGAPSDPLSLWERVGVRVPHEGSLPDTARTGMRKVIGAPSDPLSLSERVGVRVPHEGSLPDTARLG